MNWVLIIGVVILLIILLDMYAWNRWGREQTLSRLVQRWGWAAHPITLLLLGVLIGGLVVHFFGWEP